MNTLTNCMNCGAVMEYSKQNYGEIYKCEYCGTEHHIDLLGRIEEYKVKLMWQGHIIEAYMNSISVTPQVDSYRTLEGELIVNRNNPVLDLNFTGYFINEEI